MRKPRYAEITVRVRLPKGATVADARYEVTQAWYGEIFAANTDAFPRGVLTLRWGRARLVISPKR